MKFFSVTSLCFALTIPLMAVGCDSPDQHHVSSDQTTFVAEDEHGGGWCPSSAVATCQASCERVASCAVAPFFPAVDIETCVANCAEGLVRQSQAHDEAVSCLGDLESDDACCDVMGCAAAWVEPVIEPSAPNEAPIPEGAGHQRVVDGGRGSSATCSPGAEFSQDEHGLRELGANPGGFQSSIVAFCLEK